MTATAGDSYPVRELIAESQDPEARYSQRPKIKKKSLK